MTRQQRRAWEAQQRKKGAGRVRAPCPDRLLPPGANVLRHSRETEPGVPRTFLAIGHP